MCAASRAAVALADNPQRVGAMHAAVARGNAAMRPSTPASTNTPCWQKHSDIDGNIDLNEAIHTAVKFTRLAECRRAD